MTDEIMKLTTIFGPYMFIFGLWLMIFCKPIQKHVHTLRTIEPVIYLIGFINLLIGLVIIANYNVWAWDITVFLTLLGWFFFVRGFLILFFTKFMYEVMLKSHWSIQFWGILFLVWGLILSKIAFISI